MNPGDAGWSRAVHLFAELDNFLIDAKGGWTAGERAVFARVSESLRRASIGITQSAHVREVVEPAAPTPVASNRRGGPPTRRKRRDGAHKLATVVAAEVGGIVPNTVRRVMKGQPVHASKYAKAAPALKARDIDVPPLQTIRRSYTGRTYPVGVPVIAPEGDVGSLVAVVAAVSGVDRRTVAKRLRGQPLKRSVLERIDAVLGRMGLLSAPTATGAL